ncbi:hypothetical protein CPE1_0559 [Chlamydia pecorum PV3056/3]|uniref:Uncharacterized protein n=1 Tax=Chlamydia pecorum TaxID=85991 RepID=A0AA40PPT5_9CHLA|nr:DUF648 domain-containing protein [Chlamydia pecorum]AGW38046.1 hypothetical protein CPE1_0559 [Chlamydia pecorum PV3056/3]KTF28509.1 hypothetical protein cpL1_0826 [Chlamydia pecorum]
MESITLYSWDTASLSAKCAVLLDRYFYFGGEQTQIITTDGKSYVICRRIHGSHVSLLEKVLKIISYLFLPILILALLLRAILHITYRVTFIYVDSSTPEFFFKVLAASSPTEIRHCVQNIQGMFINIPRKHIMALPLVQNDILTKVTLSVNWEGLQLELAQRLNKISVQRGCLEKLFPCWFKRSREEELSQDEKLWLVGDFISFLQRKYEELKMRNAHPSRIFLSYEEESYETRGYLNLFQKEQSTLGLEALRFLQSLNIISNFVVDSSGIHIFFG